MTHITVQLYSIAPINFLRPVALSVCTVLGSDQRSEFNRHQNW